MKTIPAAVQTVVDANIGTHPYTTVTIVWDSGEVTYTDNNKILGAGQAVSDVKLGMVSDVQNISITLDDTDGTLKQKYNQEIIEGKTCIVKQNYDGVVGDVVVLRGKIIGDIVWSEGERQLSFNVESILHSDDIGFAPDEDDGVADSAVGVPWPIVFGSVAHSRAVKVISSPDMYISECVTISSRSFRVRVDGGGLPPQGAQIIRVDGIRFSGTFDGNIFTVLSSQLPTYTNVSLANPPANFPTDTKVAWLRDDGIFLQGLRCKLTLYSHPGGTQFQLNQCIKQEGKKCIFQNPWYMQLNSSHSFDLVGKTLAWSSSYGTHRTIVYGPYQVEPGTQAFLEGADEDLYVANLFPSAEVRSVFAYKTVGGERRFAPVPSNYYTVNKSQSLLGNTVTAIEFYYPLRSMLDEGWDDTIYVTLRSSLSNNLSRVIHWLMDNYTNASINATSFETVRSQVIPFPVNFTLYDRPSALTIAERIAYLGRCALTIRDNTAYLKYLSYAHAADYDLTEAVTEYKSIRMSCTLTENIYTRTVAKYRLDYSGREDDRDIIYENNVSTFGLQEKEIDFFIYNSRRLVYNSLSYWGYLYSHSWRELTISNFLKTIALDGYDVASVDIPSVSANELKGYVINTSHNSDVHSIQTKILLDSRMGLVDTNDEPQSDPRFWRYDDDPTPDESIPDDPIEDLDECRPTYRPPTNETDPVDDDEEETEYFYRVTGATSWQRASERSLTVTVVDSSGAQVSSNGTAMLSLTNKTNLLDRLNQDTRAISSISISNGQWNYNQMTITGGSGDATATIVCRGAQVIDGRLQRVHPGRMDISITDEELDQDDPGGPGTYPQRRLTWTTHPPSVVDRGQTFTIGLKYGPSGGSLRCYLVSTDGNDRLVSESGAAVTYLAFDTDPDCTHTSTVKVVGGSGEDRAVITVISRFGRQVNSQEFTIKEEEEDEEEIVDVEDGDDNWYLGPLSLTMTKSGHYDQESFALTVSLVDGAGDPVPGIDGFVFINVTDGDMSFEDIGPNGYLVSGQQAVVKLVDGTWSYADTKMSIGDPAFPQCLTAYYEDEDTGGFLYSENVCDTDEPLVLRLSRWVTVFDATNAMQVEVIGATSGERKTTITGTVALEIISGDATFTDLGPDASIISGTEATVNVVDGVWNYATCAITTGADPEVCIEASYLTSYGTTVTDNFCDSGTDYGSTRTTVIGRKRTGSGAWADVSYAWTMVYTSAGPAWKVTGFGSYTEQPYPRAWLASAGSEARIYIRYGPGDGALRWSEAFSWSFDSDGRPTATFPVFMEFKDSFGGNVQLDVVVNVAQDAW